MDQSFIDDFTPLDSESPLACTFDLHMCIIPDRHVVNNQHFVAFKQLLKLLRDDSMK